MRPARPHDNRKFELSGDVSWQQIGSSHTGQLRARRAYRGRDIKPFDSIEQAMQLVTIEIADLLRQIQNRPRPTRDGPINDGKRIPALIGIGRYHNRHIVVGQR